MRFSVLLLAVAASVMGCTAGPSTPLSGSLPSTKATPGNTSPSPPSGPTTQDLLGTRWVLSSIDGRDWPVGDEPDVTLTFREERLGGFNGCNAFGARWELDGRRLQVGSLYQTLIKCSGTTGWVERRLTAVLGARPTLNPDITQELRLTAAPEGVLVFSPK